MARKGQLQLDAGGEGGSARRSDDDKQATHDGWSRQDAQAILDNYDIETADRRIQLQRQIDQALALLQRKCAAELERFSCLASSRLTAGEFVNVHACSIPRAVAAVRALDGAQRLHSVHERNRELDEENLQRTIKKRKRVPTNGSPTKATAGTNGTNAHSFESPTKPRKNARTASTLDAMGSSQISQASDARAAAFHPPRSAVRIPSGSSARSGAGTHSSSTAAFRNRVSSAAAAAGSSSSSAFSNAGNFVYRARPSVIGAAAALNPRLPQTPSVQRRTTGPGAGPVAAAGTARQPKRNESIQAYSMNGSPLGILDIDVAVGPALSSASTTTSELGAKPSASTSESEAGDGATTEGGWELLSQSHAAGMQRPAHTSAHPQAQAQLQSQSQTHAWSPAKQAAAGRTGSLARKPTASSSFKAAILSSTAKFAPSARNASPSKMFGHAPATQTQAYSGAGRAGAGAGAGLARGFTMNVPGPSPTKAKVDWENWAGSFMRELNGMDLKGDDRQKLEQRLQEVMASQAR